MAKKTFKYRGKTLEELQELSIKELAELFPSAQRRKLKRGLSEEEKKFIKDAETGKNVKTHLRDMIVLPKMVGKIVKIHNGKEFQTITVIEEMIGMRLGELVLTRKRLTHSAPGVGATRSSAALSVR